MPNDIYIWIGGAHGRMSDPSNWLDTATHKVAITAPTANTDLVFRPGNYTVTPDNADGSVGFSAGKLLLLAGAHLTMNTTINGTAEAPGVFSFQKVVEMHNSSLTVSGAALWDQKTLLLQGATLDGSHAQIDAHALGIFPMELGSLHNVGGTVLIQGAVGNVPQADLNVGHPGPGFVQTGGFIQGESALPGASVLRIDLGSVAHGSALAPLQFGADNPANAAGFAGLTIREHGNGFITSLFPSIAAAQAVSNVPSVGGFVAIGSIDVDTSTLGSHRELVNLVSGGKTVETLVITDRVV
jgi:hypothetical protein